MTPTPSGTPTPKWSCDHKPGSCREPHGCHCREITALSENVAALRADRDRLREALKRIEREDRMEYSHARGCYAEIVHEALQSSTGAA